MGWWDGGNGDALGDGPADTFLEKLREVQERPARQGVLSAAAVALADVGPVTVEDPDQLGSRRLRARYRAPEPDAVSGGPADPALVEALCSFLFEMQEEYQYVFHRKPTVREVLRTMAFCLRGQADPYLADPGPELVEIILDH
jgi:hypothetical protein